VAGGRRACGRFYDENHGSGGTGRREQPDLCGHRGSRRCTHGGRIRDIATRFHPIRRSRVGDRAAPIGCPHVRPRVGVRKASRERIGQPGGTKTFRAAGLAYLGYGLSQSQSNTVAVIVTIGIVCAFVGLVYLVQARRASTERRFLLEFLRTALEAREGT